MLPWLRRRLSGRPPAPPEPTITPKRPVSWEFLRIMILRRVVIIAHTLGCDMENILNFHAGMQIADMLFDILKQRARELGFEAPVWVPVEFDHWAQRQQISIVQVLELSVSLLGGLAVNGMLVLHAYQRAESLLQFVRMAVDTLGIIVPNYEVPESVVVQQVASFLVFGKVLGPDFYQLPQAWLIDDLAQSVSSLNKLSLKISLLNTSNGNPAIVTLLLDHGADPQRRDNTGQTALHYAVAEHNGHNGEIVKILLEAGADVSSGYSLWRGSSPWGIAHSRRLEGSSQGSWPPGIMGSLDSIIRMLEQAKAKTETGPEMQGPGRRAMDRNRLIPLRQTCVMHDLSIINILLAPCIHTTKMGIYHSKPALQPNLPPTIATNPKKRRTEPPPQSLSPSKRVKTEIHDSAQSLETWETSHPCKRPSWKITPDGIAAETPSQTPPHPKRAETEGHGFQQFLPTPSPTPSPARSRISQCSRLVSDTHKDRISFPPIPNPTLSPTPSPTRSRISRCSTLVSNTHKDRISFRPTPNPTPSPIHSPTPQRSALVSETRPPQISSHDSSVHQSLTHQSSANTNWAHQYAGHHTASDPTASQSIPIWVPDECTRRFDVHDHYGDMYVAVHAAQQAITPKPNTFKMTVAIDASLGRPGGSCVGGVGAVFSNTDARAHTGYSWSFPKVPHNIDLLELAAIAHGIHLAGGRLAEALGKLGKDRAPDYGWVEVHIFSDSLNNVLFLKDRMCQARNNINRMDPAMRGGPVQIPDQENRPLRNKIANLIFEDAEDILKRADNVKIHLHWIKGHMLDRPATTMPQRRVLQLVKGGQHHQRADHLALWSRREEQWSLVACWPKGWHRGWLGHNQTDLAVRWQHRSRSWIYFALKDDWETLRR
ncbi:hypothetical protein B0T21DRAFT_441543 [Apiosordaria backusii]|uniref:Uncharacterized protein n=1 Tax=Apiosordaria backusii TaxID=314023 RepID=A0AA40EGF0_9PEZI|nr:hypothetical protein B0T21DRAFT_441543 [Apiosordaria backusii]